MRIIEIFETYILPNLYGSVVISIAWIAQNIKNKRKDRASVDGALLANAKIVIEMSESLTSRIDLQNERLTDQLDKERLALLEMSNKYNNCEQQLRIANDLKLDLERHIQIREKELADFKNQCNLFRKLLGYEKNNCDDGCGPTTNRVRNFQKEPKDN